MAMTEYAAARARVVELEQKLGAAQRAPGRDRERIADLTALLEIATAVFTRVAAEAAPRAPRRAPQAYALLATLVAIAMVITALMIVR